MAAFIAQIRGLLQKNPAARYGLVVVVVAFAGYLVASRLLGGGARPAPVATSQLRPPAAAPSPQAGAPAPSPAPVPTPAPAAVPQTPKISVVPPGPTGRSDPFIPLVSANPPGQTPPGATLPPPPFPGGRLPPPPLPGQGLEGAPGGPIAITGIVGDTNSVAVVNLGGRTEIVAVGDQIGDLRVLRIDATRRIVTFLLAGRRFDVAMGGE